jgi:nucleotide-binding universal stress UspA family protein
LKKGLAMFEKMLVCLDGSNLAEQILPYAEAQVKCLNAGITLLQVVILHVPQVIQAGSIYKEYEEAEEETENLTEKAKAYLLKMAATLKDKGIETDTAVIVASQVGPAIVKYAENNGINMIALASHGHTGLRDILMGSVAEYVLKHSGLPVLMVKVKKI